jgi:hypothetical protein
LTVALLYILVDSCRDDEDKSTTKSKAALFLNQTDGANLVYDFAAMVIVVVSGRHRIIAPWNDGTAIDGYSIVE